MKVRRVYDCDDIKGDEIMTMTTYNKQHNQNIQEMQNYIESLKKLNMDQARSTAQKSLINSGVLSKNGAMKKQICN